MPYPIVSSNCQPSFALYLLAGKNPSEGITGMSTENLRDIGNAPIGKERQIGNTTDRKLVFEAYERAKLAGGQLDYYTERQQHKKLFSEIPRIEGSRVVLDRIVDSDAASLKELTSNENVYRFEPSFLFERQREDAHETIRLLYGNLFTQKESLILGVRLKEDGQLAGLAEFYGLRDRLHKISVGYRLLERYWGKGLATEVAGLMVGYLYGETDIEIITASTMVGNIASARVLEKNDFICTVHDDREDWGFPEPTPVNKWFC